MNIAHCAHIRKKDRRFHSRRINSHALLLAYSHMKTPLGFGTTVRFPRALILKICTRSNEPARTHNHESCEFRFAKHNWCVAHSKLINLFYSQAYHFTVRRT